MKGDLSGHYTYSEYLRGPENVFADGIHPHFGTVPTHITQMDAQGTNCPQLYDVMINYLKVEKGNTIFNFIMNVIGYFFVMLVIYCTFPCFVNRLYPGYQKCPEWDRAIAQGYASQLPDIEEGGNSKKKVQIRGSA